MTRLDELNEEYWKITREVEVHEKMIKSLKSKQRRLKRLVNDEVDRLQIEFNFKETDGTKTNSTL